MFQNSNSKLKKSNFCKPISWIRQVEVNLFAKRFLLWNYSNTSNVQSSNSLLKTSFFSQNPFRFGKNLNFFSFKAWLACCKKLQIFAIPSVYEIMWYTSKFYNSKRMPSILNLFTIQFLLWNNLKCFKVPKFP